MVPMPFDPFNPLSEFDRTYNSVMIPRQSCKVSRQNNNEIPLTNDDLTDD